MDLFGNADPIAEQLFGNAGVENGNGTVHQTQNRTVGGWSPPDINQGNGAEKRPPGWPDRWW